MKGIDKIKNSYNFFTRGSSDMLWVKINGENKSIPKSEIEIFFTFGNENIDKNNIHKEVENGNAVSIKGIEIYKDYYNWDDDKTFLELHGFDKRTFDYFQDIKDNIGFIRKVDGHEEENLIDSYTSPAIWLNVYEMEIGKTRSGEWCVQYGYQTNIDDYNIERLYFHKKPSTNHINTIIAISGLELDFKLKKLPIHFNCFECGRFIHWLDSKGGFLDKIENLKEKQCGFSY